MLVVRELTGGIYFGEKTRTRDRRKRRVPLLRRWRSSASPASRSAPPSRVSRASTRPTCSRPAGSGARSSTACTTQEFPHIELEHALVDSTAMKLITAPRHFEVILTENMFGDILSDEASVITGSLGLLPSASIGNPDGPGLFEPVHGSAPDIAGQGVANPLAMFLSAAMMLRHGLGWDSEAATLESAVHEALAGGLRTGDLGGDGHDGRGDRRGAGQPLAADQGDTVQPSEVIWMNGEFVRWEDAQVHVLTHALHYGTSVFEGVRCYDTEIGPAVFRNQDHVDRLFKSSELYYMPVPYDREQLRQAVLETIARNNLRACYIRPLVFRGYGTMGLFPLDVRVDVAIAVWEWGSYLGDEGKEKGIRAKVSSWRRISGDSLIPQAKAGGQYLNSVLAKIESHKAGYDEAILLDDHGHVCEGSGENIYIVRDGVIYTPPLTASILDGINRRTRDPDRPRPRLRGRRARPGARRALPGRRDLPDRHGRRARAGARGRRPRGRRRPARARSRARSSASSTTRSTAARSSYREWLDPVPVGSTAPRDRARRALRRHPARRHGRRRHEPDRRGEGARRAPPRRPRRPPDRSRLPVVEPEGAGAVRAARRRAAGAQRDRRLRDDPPARGQRR